MAGVVTQNKKPSITSPAAILVSTCSTGQTIKAVAASSAANRAKSVATRPKAHTVFFLTMGNSQARMTLRCGMKSAEGAGM